MRRVAHQPIRRLIGFALAALAVTGCSLRPDRPTEPTKLPAPSAELEALYNQQPAWRDCAGIQCATIRVPRDWADPSGPTIGLAVSRRLADDTPRGVVVVNFGGPGAAGAQVLKSSPDYLGETIGRSYDVVSFDPRGTGESEPIDCLSDSALDGYLAFTAPESGSVNAAETTEAQNEARALASGCGSDDPALLAHLGTTDVVRDLDLLRSVLDQRTLTYVGYSYGTLIGALYADRFPTNVGRFVLDGALDPSMSYDELVQTQADGMETALRAYVTGCLQGEAGDCPLRGDTDQAMRQIGDLLGQATDSPLPAGGSRPLTGQLAVTAVISALYRQSSWPKLSSALGKAMDGDGEAMLALADDYNGRTPSGRYSSNISEAYWAVTCLDYPMLTDPAAIARRRAEIRTAATTLGPYLEYSSLPCADWSTAPTRTPQRVSGEGAGPILVIGATGDPATPYPLAQSLAAQLASGMLLTRRGTGHASFRQGYACIDSLVEKFVLDGAAPAAGTVCD